MPNGDEAIHHDITRFSARLSMIVLNAIDKHDPCFFAETDEAEYFSINLQEELSHAAATFFRKME